MVIATTRAGITTGVAIAAVATAIGTADTGDLQKGSALGAAAGFASPLALMAVSKGKVSSGAFGGAMFAGMLTGVGINLAATGAKALE